MDPLSLRADARKSLRVKNRCPCPTRPRRPLQEGHPFPSALPEIQRSGLVRTPRRGAAASRKIRGRGR